VDQVFALKFVSDEYLEKQTEVFLAFLDIKKAYDRVDKIAMSEVLRMYGVEDKILSATKSMYEESMVCVRIGRKLGRKYKVDVGLYRDVCYPYGC
jgi:flavoprotein